MWLAGVRHLVVLADSCVTCDTAPMVWMEAMVAQFNQLAECRNLDRIKLNSASPAEVEHWQVTQEPVDRSRRAFLRRFRVAASAENTDEVGAQSPDALQRFLAQGAQHLPESMLYPFAPRIDADACVGCDSCVTICPHEALTLIKAQNGKSVYHSAAERCTGCLLCSDICDVDAIEVFGMSSRGADIPLSRFQCRACGVQSHTPHPQPPTDGLCRICQGTGHYNKLFLVLE